MTEISLIVTLNNQFTLPYRFRIRDFLLRTQMEDEERTLTDVRDKTLKVKVLLGYSVHTHLQHNKPMTYSRDFVFDTRIKDKERKTLMYIVFWGSRVKVMMTCPMQSPWFLVDYTLAFVRRDFSTGIQAIPKLKQFSNMSPFEIFIFISGKKKIIHSCRSWSNLG